MGEAIRYGLADSAEGLFDKWLPSAVLRMPVTERWEVHTEWFGSWTDGLEDERVRPFPHDSRLTRSPDAALDSTVDRQAPRVGTVRIAVFAGITAKPART